MNMRVVLTGSLAAALLLSAGLASAQVRESKSEDGYGYRFDDDPLSAGGFAVGDATIKVRPTAPRVTLLRLRGNFVPEMLHSVEHL